MASFLEIEQSITSWRRSEPNDVHEIKKLVKVPQTVELFGEINVADIIEKSTISLCQENLIGRIVSNISLCDHPNIPAVPSCRWLEWIRTLYKMERVTAHNTMFIHLLVWSPNYANTFLKLLLKTVFSYKYYLQYILLVVPPNAPTADIFDEFFTRLLPRNETDCGQVQTLLLCMREHYIPRLKIREALAEDNDDLIPILDKKNKDLKELYGEYYIAEMVQHCENERQMIVAEHKEQAIGILSMSTNIDFQLLNERFELAPYYGLRKPDDRDNVLSPEMAHAASTYGLHLPLLIRSDDSLSKLSIISTLFETDSTVVLQEKETDTGGILKSESEDTFMIDEQLDVISQTETEENTSLRSSKSSICEDTEDESPKMKKPPISQKVSVARVPTYHGKPNAFMVELFAMHEDWDERLSVDFLEAAFECYPEMDYCIMTIPPTFPTFPLLECFVRVVPRPSQTFPHELYVCHKNSILSEVTVRVATHTHLPTIKALFSNIACFEQIIYDLKSAINKEDSIFKAYVILSDEDVVGIAIVVSEDEIMYLQSHYEIETYLNLNLHKYDEHGILKYFAVSPIFSNHIRFFLKEILRQSDYSCLYHLLYSQDVDTIGNERLLITALDSMIPVLPRRQIKYDTEILEDNIPTPIVLRTELPFALYVMNKRYSSLPKTCVNTRIVVVGASNTALSFLETLLFGNITLVAPHGLPGSVNQRGLSNKLIIYDSHYTSQYLAKLNLRTWVNLIYGIATAINRKEKYIVINEEAVIQYDYLMLFCGEQFQIPQNVKPLDPERCVHGRRKSIDDISTDVLQNVFCINTDIDACNAMTALKGITRNRSSTTIIVYGKCLEAYNCVAVLQECGIPGLRICFVEPLGCEFPNISIFNDSEVDDAVISSLKNEMIDIYSGYYFVEWKLNGCQHRITSARFESKTKSANIDCEAMFYYGTKSVSRYTFLALEQEQLVFDGRLVINANFGTSDQFIYAAGSFTKYARRYYGDRYSHRYYNSTEIGAMLGTQMLNMWDPTVKTCQKLDEIPPLFTKPIIKSCKLPGNKKYLTISKPGIVVPLEAAMCQDEYGIALVTGDCRNDTSNDYFKIHLNSSNKIETIICYTKNEIDIDNIIALYGFHERMLNNLMLRFKLGYIPDFYTYFREPWCYALIHDHFQNFMERRKEIFKTAAEDRGSPVLVDELKRHFRINNWERMSHTKIDDFKNMYRLQHEKQIEQGLITFLAEHGYHLPMYTYPEALKLLLYDYKSTPLFVETEPYSSSEDSEDNSH